MAFEWDEDKRLEAMERRGVEGIVFTKIDYRADYGEVRLISLGRVCREHFVVAHTERNGVTRLITAWKAGRIDQEQYEAGLARRDQENG